jgi:hypothetical protein
MGTKKSGAAGYFVATLAKENIKNLPFLFLISMKRERYIKNVSGTSVNMRVLIHQ